MKKTIIKNVQIVNNGTITTGDVLIKDRLIEKINGTLDEPGAVAEHDGNGLFLMPGLIDDQVHFREPGLTHKAEIFTESRAAVAGGVTSFMEMPNVVPQTLTQKLLQAKYDIADARSIANYSFYMGASNDNLEEVMQTNPKEVCGIKIFMGSSTGNMLVDNPATLDKIFANAPILIATHCEDEKTIRQNTEAAIRQYGEEIPFEQHPVIRSAEACYLSSAAAIALAKKHNTRLHILHISTAIETDLFTNNIPLTKKRITSEACIHHLWYSDQDYATKGAWIKWNPAVKSPVDRECIWKALLDDRIDVIATDHAPHTMAEKQQKYLKAPSGGPLVQHALVALLDLYHEGRLTLPQIANKTAHAVAQCFEIENRGFIEEGHFADLVLVDVNKPWTVTKHNILAKCGWSPFEGHTFKSSVLSTWVSGHLAWHAGKINEGKAGLRMSFNRA